MKALSLGECRNITAVSAFLCIFALVVSGYILAKYPANDSDFIQDYQAATALVQGKSLYGFWNPHPPLNALLFLPLTLFPSNIAFQIFGVISLICFVLSVRMLVAEFHMKTHLVAVILALCLLWPQHQAVLALGAISSIITALIIGGWVAERRNLAALSGFCLGVASLLKVYPAFFGLYLLGARQWKALAFFILTILLGSSLCLVVIGLDDHRLFLQEALPKNLERFFDFKENVSLPGTIERFFGDPGGWSTPIITLSKSKAIASLISGCAILLLMVFSLRFGDTRDNQMIDNRGRRDLLFCLSCVAMFLVSPITWGHYLVTLVAPLVIIGHYAYLQERKSVLMLVGVIALLISGFSGGLTDLLIPGASVAPFVWYQTLGFSCYTLGMVLCGFAAILLLPEYSRQ